MAVKIKLTKDGKFYGYLKLGRYVREELSSKRGCSDRFRIKEIKPGVKVLICIRNKPGKRGGKTKAIAILRDINIKHKDKNINRIIKKAKQVKIRIKKKGRD